MSRRYLLSYNHHAPRAAESPYPPYLPQFGSLRGLSDAVKYDTSTVA